MSGLTVEDHVTLVVLEKYLDFKVRCFSYLKKMYKYILCQDSKMEKKSNKTGFKAITYVVLAV